MVSSSKFYSKEIKRGLMNGPEDKFIYIFFSMVSGLWLGFWIPQIANPSHPYILILIVSLFIFVVCVINFYENRNKNK